jgi:hypothetical protein
VEVAEEGRNGAQSDEIPETSASVRDLPERTAACGSVPLTGGAPMTGLASTPVVANIELGERVCAEYLDMPGLIISVRQGCRLWSADAAAVQEVLDELVHDGFLCHAGDSGQYYIRVDSGPAGVGRR